MRGDGSQWISQKTNIRHQCLQTRFETTRLVSSRVHFPGFSLANYFSRLTRLRPSLFTSPRPFQCNIKLLNTSIIEVFAASQINLNILSYQKNPRVLVRIFMNKSLCTNIIIYTRMFYRDFWHQLADVKVLYSPIFLFLLVPLFERYALKRLGH